MQLRREPEPSVNAESATLPLDLPQPTSRTEHASVCNWTHAKSGDHFVQFYEQDDFLLQSVGTFIGAGLGAGEGAIVLATEPHRVLLDARLAMQGIDVPAMKARGQFVSLDAANTLSQFMVNGSPDEDRFNDVVGSIIAQTAEGRPGLRAFGEMVALLWADGKKEAVVRLEELWNNLGKTQPFALLCGYPMDGFRRATNGDSFGCICGRHSRVIPAEGNALPSQTADERLRSIPAPQQKANAFEAEIAERSKVEAELRTLKNELEAQLEERSRVEIELRRRTRELTSFVETAPIGLHWIGPDGRIIWANATEMNLLGYTAEEYIGRRAAEFDTDQKVIESMLARLHRGEELHDFEARLRCKDGSIKQVLIDSSVLWENGTFVHAQCFMRDITAAKRTERRLAVQSLVSRVLSESPSLEDACSGILQAVCNTANWDLGAVWLADDQARELRCAQLWQRPEARIGEFASVSYQRAFEPGIGLPGRVWASGNPVWISNLSEDSNFPRAAFAQKDGLRSAVAFPIKVERTIIGTIEFFSRESRQSDDDFLELVNTIGSQIGQFVERKRAEKSIFRLAAIVASSDDAIISKDLNGVITSWNKAAEQMFGYSESEAIGRQITMLIPPELQSEELTIISRIRRGEPIEHYETIRRCKDGTLLDISLSVSPIKDARGKIIGASKIARDITATKRAERALREATEELARVNEELESRVCERTASLEQAVSQMEEFSYSVSHDLRAPVRAMHSYAKILMEDYGNRLDDNGREYLDRIIRGGTRMDRLIEDVLTYSRLSRRELKLRPVPLDKLVRDVIQTYPQIHAAQITIQGGLASVMGHEPSLTQAVSNLLNNAIKFVSPGTTPKVRVRTERRDGNVRLWVEDNGIGIKQEYQHRLFGLFERIHPEKSYEGTGIGLAIVRKSLERMGGQVGVESDGLTGSNFWIQLPAADTVAEPQNR
jgi:PAS domain S-box-containing protein